MVYQFEGIELAAVGNNSSASRKSAEALDQVRTRLRGYGADFVSVGAIIFARSLPGFLSKERRHAPTPRGRRAALIEADPIALNGRIEEAQAGGRFASGWDGRFRYLRASTPTSQQLLNDAPGALFTLVARKRSA